MSNNLIINKKNLHYLDEGPRDGAVILFGHSFIWNAEMWRPQIDLLKKQYRCIVPDLWGHGQSAALTEDSYSLQDIAQDYLTLLDTLNIEKCIVVGLSVGGMWGVELALIAPERVQGLVIMDSYVGPEAEDKQKLYYDLIDSSVPNGFSKEIIDIIVPIFFCDVTATQGNPIFENFKLHLADYKKENLTTLQKLARTIFARDNKLVELSSLTMPCLVMVGAEDKPRPAFEAQEMAELIGCECIEVSNAGHIANLENVALVNEKLSMFIAQYK